MVAGLELGGVPIVTALSLKTGLAAAFVRKEAKTYGTRCYGEGIALSGKQFVLVEVVSSGGVILDALKKLRTDGLEPSAVLCVIDRETGGREVLVGVGLPLLSVLRTSNLDHA